MFWVNLMQRQLSAATIWGGDDTVGSLLRSVAAVRMMAACDLPMRIDDFEWTLERVDHIALHSVTPEEVEEVMSSAPVFKRGRGGVYESWGQTDSGRYLLVIFRYLGHNRAWPITARDMDENESKGFCRKK